MRVEFLEAQAFHIVAKYRHAISVAEASKFASSEGKTLMPNDRGSQLPHGFGD